MLLSPSMSSRCAAANGSFYDSEGLGYLREQDLENYVYDHIPTMAALHAIHDNFYPFYVFTAVRRFMFFLDPKRTGVCSLRVIQPSLCGAAMRANPKVPRMFVSDAVSAGSTCFSIK